MWSGHDSVSPSSLCLLWALLCIDQSSIGKTHRAIRSYKYSRSSYIIVFKTSRLWRNQKYTYESGFTMITLFT